MRTPFQVETIRTLYASGLSTRAIATRVGLDCAQVYRYCKDIVRPHVRPDSTNWRTCRRRAREIMTAHLGRQLTQNEVVHHVDGDFTNNDLSNLQVLTRAEHTREHVDQGLGSRSNPGEYKRAYYLQNKEARDAKIKAWRERNPEKVAANRARDAEKRRQRAAERRSQ